MLSQLQSRKALVHWFRNQTGHELCLHCNDIYTARVSHSEHRFPASSSKLLPDLVTPLKGHSLFPHSCPPTQSAPSERFGYWYDCGSSLAPKHPRKHETHPPRVKKREKKKKVPSLFKRLWFLICTGVNFVGGYKWQTLFSLNYL